MSDRFAKAFTARYAVEEETGRIAIQILDRLGNVAANIDVPTALELSADLSGACCQAIRLANQRKQRKLATAPIVGMDGRPL